MSSLVIELTNSCNLNCRHCSDKRHGAEGYLQLDIIGRVLQEARTLGFDHISFTGGEPTLHPEFTEIIDMINRAEYKYGFVSNGWNFSSIYSQLESSCSLLTGITFSLDGAGSDTHDRVRGNGSFRRLMSAVSICVAKDIPFVFNTLITTNNSHELREIVDISEKLGSRGLRFGHLIPTRIAVENSLDLSPDDRKDIDESIKQIVQQFRMPVVNAPGYYTSNLFPCEPLKGREMNIDCKGNVSICCHLSGFGDNRHDKDIIGSLSTISFAEAYERTNSLNRKFHEEKVSHFNERNAADTDYFPCWYCLNYFRKLEWLKAFPQNSWHKSVWLDNNNRREIIDAEFESESKA